MNTREETKHKGIYKRGNVYYVIYNDGTFRTSKSGEQYPVRREKRVEGNLDDALKFKVEMEEAVKKGRHYLLLRMEKTSFEKLVELYGKEKNGKDYVLLFEKDYLKFFKGRRLGTITRSDLFDFRDHLKARPKRWGRQEMTDTSVNRALAGLRRLFHYAVAKEYLEKSPFPEDPKSGLFYPEKKGLRNFFTENELLRVIEAAPKWMKPLSSHHI